MIAAFAAVYLVWGSTYLAIRFAIETLPPFGMAGARFLLAGVLLWGWLRLRGEPGPRGREWRSAALVGTLLLVVGNGGVVWAESRIPSGIAALLVATLPLWMTLLDWLRPGGRAPAAQVWFGIAIGFGGLILLAGPGQLAGGGRPDALGVAAVVAASVAWAVGSIYSRSAVLPRSPLMATAAEMLCAGAGLLALSLAVGEPGRWNPSAVSAGSVLAWLYLVFAGSLLAFSAYVYLLGVAPASQVSTYAYVNPVVAVALGYGFAGEAVTARMALAGVAIVAGVVAITTAPRRG